MNARGDSLRGGPAGCREKPAQKRPALPMPACHARVAVTLVPGGEVPTAPSWSLGRVDEAGLRPSWLPGCMRYSAHRLQEEEEEFVTSSSWEGLALGLVQTPCQFLKPPPDVLRSAKAPLLTPQDVGCTTD